MQTATMPMGTLSANSHRQWPTDSTADAIGGPMAAEVATTIELMPSARPSMFVGYVNRTSAGLTLMMPAAPSPWATRAMLSVSSEVENAHASDPIVKSTSPACETRLYPTISP